MIFPRINVQHRSIDPLMPKLLLNRHEIRAALKHVCRQAVPKAVRMHVLFHRRAFRDRFDDLPDPPGRDMLIVGEIIFQHLGARGTEKARSFALAFALYPDRIVVEIDVLDPGAAICAYSLRLFLLSPRSRVT
jgi:hypothetical protein